MSKYKSHLCLFVFFNKRSVYAMSVYAMSTHRIKSGETYSKILTVIVFVGRSYRCFHFKKKNQ